MKVEITRWGAYEILSEDRWFDGHEKVKKITVNPGCGISFQKHNNRKETWYVACGELTVAVGPSHEDFNVKADEKSFYIEKGIWHQFWNFGTVPVIMIEIQSSSIDLGCQENDIERFCYDWIDKANKTF